MAKETWNWVLLVIVYDIFNNVTSIKPIGPFNSQSAAHDYQHTWLRNHEADHAEAGTISFEVTQLGRPE